MNWTGLAGKLIGKGIGHGINSLIERRVETAKNTWCCSACYTVVEKSAAACHACGSQEIITKYQLREIRKAQKQARLDADMEDWAIQAQDNEIAAFDRQHKKDFKRKRKELARGRWCDKCETLHPRSHKFCPHCTTGTRSLHKDEVQMILEFEFPDQFEEYE